MRLDFDAVATAIVAFIDRALRPKVLWLSLLGLALALSLVLTLASSPARPATLWFPDARSSSGKSIVELRYIRAGRDKAESAARVVEEMLLGPMNAFASPVSVPVSGVLASIQSGKKLYIDLSGAVLFGKPSAGGVYGAPPVEPRVTLAYIRRTLEWNFSSTTIVLTVDGRVPAWDDVETAPDRNNK